MLHDWTWVEFLDELDTQIVIITVSEKGGDKELPGNEYQVSALQKMKNALEIDDADGYKTVGIYLMTWNCTLKMVKMQVCSLL